MLFVKKKDGSLRMCCGYRALNKITVRNKFPLPRIDDLLDRLHGSKVLSSIDLQGAYNQIAIEPSDRQKTAFRTPIGLYQWRVMPFGLTNAPAFFARTMQSAFSDFIGKCVLIYLDDILIYSKTPEENVQHFAMVLQRLQDNQLYAKMSKCHCNLPEVEFLGHTVGRDGIRVDPRKVAIVKEWPVPQDKHQLRSFLGLYNYFRRFIMA